MITKTQKEIAGNLITHIRLNSEEITKSLRKSIQEENEIFKRWERQQMPTQEQMQRNYKML